jgi:hypothetical protein
MHAVAQCLHQARRAVPESKNRGAGRFAFSTVTFPPWFNRCEKRIKGFAPGAPG